MASNYTTNYNLCQWEPTDQVQRTDFNADNAKIDAALAEHAATLSCLGNCQVYLHTYTGTGENGPHTFTFPSPVVFFTILGSNETWACGVRGVNKLHGRFSANSYLPTPISWGETSLTIGNSDWNSMYCCNTAGVTYALMALLDRDE